MILYKIFNMEELLKNNHDFVNMKNLRIRAMKLMENFKSSSFANFSSGNN